MNKNNIEKELEVLEKVCNSDTPKFELLEAIYYGDVSDNETWVDATLNCVGESVDEIKDVAREFFTADFLSDDDD